MSGPRFRKGDLVRFRLGTAVRSGLREGGSRADRNQGPASLPSRVFSRASRFLRLSLSCRPTNFNRCKAWFRRGERWALELLDCHCMARAAHARMTFRALRAVQ